MAATSHDRRLNALLILSGAVLTLLLVVFLGRMVVPRIQSERTSEQDGLISDIIQVQVLNGAGRAGLANRFTAVLRKSGFDVVESGNFESFDVPHTYVIDRIGNLDHARRVARALTVSEDRIIREVSSEFFLDATVVIGLDYDTLNLP